MSIIVNIAEKVMGYFDAIGDSFTGMFTGIVPTLLGVLTLVYFIIKALGEKRIEKFAEILASNFILKFSIFPIFTAFFLGNPAGITMGKFLPERSKPGVMEAKFRIGHPLTAFFPHVNPAELFIWMGVAQGVEELGLSISALGIRYIITGVVVGTISGIICERIFFLIAKRNNYNPDEEARQEGGVAS